MRKHICIVLALLLTLAAFAACAKTPETAEETPAPTAVIVANSDSDAADGSMDTQETLPPTDADATDAAAADNVLTGVSFVMIYDPYIFDELSEEQSRLAERYSGAIGSQIVTGLHRAGGIGEEPEVEAVVSQADINKGLDTGIADRASGRAGGADPVYAKGDTHAFYSFDSRMSYRSSQEFTCVYAGEYCYIWAIDGSIDEADAESVAQEFDEKIYHNDTTFFGTPRFTENGGKINILFYSLPRGIGGFFCRYDIFSATEVPASYIDLYGLNTDHAIITLNSDLVKTDRAFVNATLAHELQHLICASEAFYYSDSPFVRTWLDEAMSAYAEELNYPGIKVKGHYNELMYLSDNYRKGQSLYNFSTDGDEYIGAYGTVYLFDRYLIEHAGSDVFSKIHNYWKNSYSADVAESNALMATVPEAYMKEINDAYTFPEAIRKGFADETEEWMSKMTLDFYLETVSMELAELTDVEDVAHLFMLYSEVDPLYLEGGGRIIVAVENGTFEIPTDSDRDLIYIGFDSEFNVVTELYTNAK